MSTLPWTLSVGANTSFVLFTAVTFISLYIVSRFLSIRYPAPFPPGPKGFPLLGNLLDVPEYEAWKVFAEWRQVWGDIVYIKVLGQSTIILNSLDAAIEMLDKKSYIYSDRPGLTMGGELVGWNQILVLTPYGDRFRKYRKLFHQFVGTHSGLEESHSLPVVERETRKFLQAVLKDPPSLSQHIRRTVTAYILRISHGYSLEEEGDGLVQIVEKATAQLSVILAPGSFIVDVFPALRHIPGWFPGASFRKKAELWSEDLNDMVNKPHEFVKEHMAAGTADASFTADSLDRDEVEESVVKWAAASLYSGASDTTISTINAFFLSMTMYPHIQKKAQAEIDSVVGPYRLPTFADRASLPFVNALVKEVFRCFPAGPLASWIEPIAHGILIIGVPHRVTEADIHTGYFIPKGTTIIANIWGFLHDPERYTDPMEFNPERFLPSDSKAAGPDVDPYLICFGFGRRSCPGALLADAVLYLTCAMSLAVLDICKARGEDGVDIEPVYKSTKGVISHPAPFRFSIRPRSVNAEALVDPITE